MSSACFDPRIQAVADLLDGKESVVDVAKAWSGPDARGLAFTRDGELRSQAGEMGGFRFW